MSWRIGLPHLVYLKERSIYKKKERALPLRYNIMNELKKKFMELGINFGNIVSVTTDGAPSMVGKNCGFVKLLIDEVKHDLVQFHCMIHQQALCAKNTFKSLEKVMSIVTKVVNL